MRRNIFPRLLVAAAATFGALTAQAFQQAGPGQVTPPSQPGVQGTPPTVPPERPGPSPERNTGPRTVPAPGRTPSVAPLENGPVPQSPTEKPSKAKKKGKNGKHDAPPTTAKQPPQPA